MTEKVFEALLGGGGPERRVREAAKRAARLECQCLLEALEREPIPKEPEMAAKYAEWVQYFRRKVGINESPDAERTRQRVERKHALGCWGEQKAVVLLERAGFVAIEELSTNHPFGDICAERTGARYLVGVKTRNKYQANGLINPTFNVRKRGVDVEAICQRHKADYSAWVAISVIPEQQLFSAYFGTIKQIQETGERFSIPMMPEQVARYECLSRPAEEVDPSIRAEWSNGGYLAHETRRALKTKTSKIPYEEGANK